MTRTSSRRRLTRGRTVTAVEFSVEDTGQAARRDSSEDAALVGSVYVNASNLPAFRFGTELMITSTSSGPNLAQALSRPITLVDAHLPKPAWTPKRKARWNLPLLAIFSGPNASSMCCTKPSASANHSEYDVRKQGRRCQPSTKPVIRALTYSAVAFVSKTVLVPELLMKRKIDSLAIAATESRSKAWSLIAW